MSAERICGVVVALYTLGAVIAGGHAAARYEREGYNGFAAGALFTAMIWPGYVSYVYWSNP